MDIIARGILILCMSICQISLVSCAAHSRKWAKSEKIAAGVFIGAHLMDWHSTEQLLDDPGRYETNRILGRHPTDEELAIFFPVSGMITIGLCHFFPSLRQPMLWAYAGINMKNAIYNYNEWW